MKEAAKHTIPEEFLFPADESVPNNPLLPALVYRQAIDPEEADLADRFERIFAENGWVDGWRDSVYPYHHYHSVTHEALGVSRGHAKLALGGPEGQIVIVAAGDAIALPAGIGHKRVDSSDDFEVVGAYPSGSDFNLLRAGDGDRENVRQQIAATPLPQSDPLYGPRGPLRQIWRSGEDATLGDSPA